LIAAMSRFITVDRQTTYLLPPSVDEWLPAPDGHPNSPAYGHLKLPHLN
jgi:hypothetical protein